ncbi:MAG: HlyD family efflux transporter periplasmic adaptor subunit [Bacteroidetes bacterium]|nr:MAG: HlyD family efflux transporter periplasmic adaptor subunit [Bacteroidota bacterium]
MKFNPVYLVMVLGLLVLIPVARHFQQRPSEFYGIAEDPDLDLSLEYAGVLKEVLVQEGDMVAPHQPLAVLERTNLPYLRARLNEEQKLLRAEIEALEQESTSYRKRLVQARELARFEVDNKIAELEGEQARNQTLLQQMQSLSLENIPLPTDPKLAALRSEREEVVKTYDLALAELRKKLDAQRAVLQARLDKVAVEQQELDRQSEAMTLRAPSPGIIGRIHFVPGEQLAAGDIILNLYYEHPTQVIAYVPEGLLTAVEHGDELQIQSLQDTKYQITGKVTSLGTKIRELPIRMRRDPSVQAWGREVRLQIDPTNQLLQGERVLVIQSEK